MSTLFSKTSAGEIAESLRVIGRVPNCEDCELLRGANLLAKSYFGDKHANLFDKNIASIITTHVDLNCRECPVEQVMKKLKKDRFAAIAAMF
ncbi:MAG: hypothetical protein R3F48_06890 [Candidatus Zixiibacteriota bacterium]